MFLRIIELLRLYADAEDYNLISFLNTQAIFLHNRDKTIYK